MFCIQKGFFFPRSRELKSRWKLTCCCLMHLVYCLWLKVKRKTKKHNRTNTPNRVSRQAKYYHLHSTWWISTAALMDTCRVKIPSSSWQRCQALRQKWAWSCMELTTTAEGPEQTICRENKMGTFIISSLAPHLGVISSMGWQLRCQSQAGAATQHSGSWYSPHGPCCPRCYWSPMYTESHTFT